MENIQDKFFELNKKICDPDQEIYAFPGLCYLGESPIWHPELNAFFWTDIYGKKIFSCKDPYSSPDHSTDLKTYELNIDNIACMGPAYGGKLICGFNTSGVGIIEFDDQNKIKISMFENSNPLEIENNDLRFNDGKVLSDGTFILGSMHLMPRNKRAEMMESNQKAKGKLYKFDNQTKKCTELVDDIFIFNGCVLSNDQKKYYFVDSPRGEIQVFSYKNQEISNRETFFKQSQQNPELGGVFDGASFNQENNLLWAVFGGSKIVLLNTKTGSIDKVIQIKGMESTTSVAFGGADMKTMLVTSARFNRQDQDLSGQNGGVAFLRFNDDPQFTGPKAPLWSGN